MSIVLFTPLLSEQVRLPGLGPRKRVVDTLGNLMERLAGSIDGNPVILHFDR